ncbi:MAG TPA: endonuclease domain-containing protein [Pyrinomonadaceae bacterium]|nr:endonuclease domain-containing protein [Pyrinomonadaceae bacterium]
MTYDRRPKDVHNLPDTSQFRRELRRGLTPAEARLWTLLKNSRLEGRKFRRQHSVGKYVLDFYCPSEKLAVELDGEGHFTLPAVSHDAERRRFLESYGIRVIRFENESVFKSEKSVLARIISEFGWSQRT